MYEAYGKTGNRCLVAVVGQRYAVNVMDEHVLRGNAAIIKCHIPSFVAEFVEVDSWIEDEKTEIYPSTDYGRIRKKADIDYLKFWVVQKISIVYRMEFKNYTTRCTEGGQKNI
ncbi:hypothetical protein K0M31_004760 [Melipona bicolor]|uniref:Uncharacterized protein n=1 Tax=Melipona bicolor TaxID=60889 RepID=A0AA40FW18_9HYME|nr:hypothetical protein K0M31_004760 [Melipona bicolor]